MRAAGLGRHVRASGARMSTPSQPTAEFPGGAAAHAAPASVRVALVGGSADGREEDLYRLLRRRLRVFTSFYAIEYAVATIVTVAASLQPGPWEGVEGYGSFGEWWGPGGGWLPVSAAAASFSAAAVLWLRPPATVRGLRVVELAFVGWYVLHILIATAHPRTYHDLEIAAGETPTTAGALIGNYVGWSALTWFQFLVMYSVLVPNTGRRSAVVVGGSSLAWLLEFAALGLWVRPLPGPTIFIVLSNLALTLGLEPTGCSAVPGGRAHDPRSWRHPPRVRRRRGSCRSRSSVRRPGTGFRPTPSSTRQGHRCRRARFSRFGTTIAPGCNPHARPPSGARKPVRSCGRRPTAGPPMPLADPNAAIIELHGARSSASILGTVVVLGLTAYGLYYSGVLGRAIGLFSRTVRWVIRSGFMAWEATLAWAPWWAILGGALGTLGVGFLLVGSAPAVGVLIAGIAIYVGVTACLAYMFIDLERYEVERGYKAVHNPLKGQELAPHLVAVRPAGRRPAARGGDRRR